MKTGIVKNEIYKSDEDFEVEGFEIVASAKAYEVLSNSLYKNKIRAIIRELSCNAYDAHVEAGHPSRPFVIHLPNKLEPIFSIRDFGTGISHKDISKVYRKYFKSTKDQSNDLIGCLGLGSKTPFSYTDSFTVTSWNQGKKSVYIAFKNEKGKPDISLMGSEESDEPSGLEVSFGVQSSDFYRFVDEAKYVFKWFKILPLFEGHPVSVIQLQKKEIDKGIFVSNDIENSVALMGNIAYPISKEALQHNKFDESIIDLIDNIPFVLEFPIGTLEIHPSREELHYDKLTISSLDKRLKDIKNNFDQKIQKIIDDESTIWNASLALQQFIQDNPKIKKYIKINEQNGLLKKDGKPFNVNSVRNKHRLARLSIKSRYYSNDFKTELFEFDVEIPISKDVKFVFVRNDSRKYSHGIFRTWMRYKQNEILDKRFYVLQGETFPNQINEIITELGIVENENYYFWDNMPRKPSAINRSGNKRKKEEAKRLNLNALGNSNVSAHWFDYEKIDLKNGEGFYVKRTNNAIDFPCHFSQIKKLSSLYFSSYQKELKIWGLTKRQIDNLGSGWIPLEQFFELIYLQIGDDQSIIDSINYLYTINNVVLKVDKKYLSAKNQAAGILKLINKSGFNINYPIKNTVEFLTNLNTENQYQNKLELFNYLKSYLNFTHKTKLEENKQTLDPTIVSHVENLNNFLSKHPILNDCLSIDRGSFNTFSKESCETLVRLCF